MGGARSSPA